MILTHDPSTLRSHGLRGGARSEVVLKTLFVLLLCVCVCVCACVSVFVCVAYV